MEEDLGKIIFRALVDEKFKSQLLDRVIDSFDDDLRRYYLEVFKDEDRLKRY